MQMKKIMIALIIILLIFILIVPVGLPEKVMKILYPIKYENFVESYSEKYQVNKYLIFALIKAESNFNEQAVSSKEAKGLMQIMDSTAKDICKKLDITISQEEISKKLLQPQFNINLGTKYISTLIAKYDSIELALAAYNAGSGNVDSWIKDGTLNSDGSNIENVPYKETNNYVRKILRDYKIYKDLYER